MKRGLLPGLILLAACSTGGSGNTISEGGVAVTAQLDGSTVKVKLLPEKGFHVYGLSLPERGVDGLGVPTRVVPAGSLTARGPASANEVEEQLTIADLGVTLPVYPPGPVTISVPVTKSARGRPSVTLTFGSCSDRICNRPVIARQVPVG
jgi:hypothetical protein